MWVFVGFFAESCCMARKVCSIIKSRAYQNIAYTQLYAFLRDICRETQGSGGLASISGGKFTCTTRNYAT